MGEDTRSTTSSDELTNQARDDSRRPRGSVSSGCAATRGRLVRLGHLRRIERGDPDDRGRCRRGSRDADRGVGPDRRDRGRSGHRRGGPDRSRSLGREIGTTRWRDRPSSTAWSGRARSSAIGRGRPSGRCLLSLSPRSATFCRKSSPATASLGRDAAEAMSAVLTRARPGVDRVGAGRGWRRGAVAARHRADADAGRRRAAPARLSPRNRHQRTNRGTRNAGLLWHAGTASTPT